MNVKAIIETAIYVNDLDAAERFYHQVFDLRVMGKEPGRHVFFQVNDSQVLLAFRAETTIQGGMLPAHGAHGPGHFAMGIDTQDLARWRDHLQQHSVAIEKEVTWPRGGQSLYFRDPAGNSVELITPGIWGLPSGW